MYVEGEDRVSYEEEKKRECKMVFGAMIEKAAARQIQMQMQAQAFASH